MCHFYRCNDRQGALKATCFSGKNQPGSDIYSRWKLQQWTHTFSALHKNTCLGSLRSSKKVYHIRDGVIRYISTEFMLISAKLEAIKDIFVLVCYCSWRISHSVWVGANLVKIPGFSPQERVNCISLKKQPNLKYCQVGQKRKLCVSFNRN